MTIATNISFIDLSHMYNKLMQVPAPATCRHSPTSTKMKLITTTASTASTGLVLHTTKLIQNPKNHHQAQIQSQIQIQIQIQNKNKNKNEIANENEKETKIESEKEIKIENENENEVRLWNVIPHTQTPPQPR